MARDLLDLAPIARWRADQQALVTAGGTQAADGETVTTWLDSIGGQVAAQQTVTRRPILRAASLGGRPALEFNTDDALVVAAPWQLSAAFTALVVARMDGSTAARGPLGLDRGTGAGNRGFRLRYNTATQAQLVAFDSTGATALIDTQAAARTSPEVLTGVRRTTDAQLYVNGASDGPTAGAAQPPSTAHWLSIGTDNASTSTGNAVTTGLVGVVAEVAIWHRVLTAAELVQAHSYAQDRYGIPVTGYVADATAKKYGVRMKDGRVAPVRMRDGREVPVRLASGARL